MPPENDNTPVTLLAMKVLAQMGVLLVLIIGGSVLLGLLLDELFSTRPTFIFILLLGSIPVTLYVIYRYSTYQSKRIMASQEEDNIP